MFQYSSRITLNQINRYILKWANRKNISGIINTIAQEKLYLIKQKQRHVFKAQRLNVLIMSL